MSKVIERRGAGRGAAVENQASLTVGRGERVRRDNARIKNIGPKGALIQVPEELPLHEPLWLRLERPVKTDWIEATPVRFGQRHDVGIMFREPCRDDLLLAAVLDLDFDWVVEQRDSSSSD